MEIKKIIRKDNHGGFFGERRGRRTRQQNFGERPAQDFEHKMIDLRRVARVVAGGRRFSFRATVVVGDRAGKVGVGIGKGADTALAIEKALREGKKRLIKVPITKTNSIPREVDAKFKAAKILLKPAPEGKGLVCGGSARTVLDFAGVKNATAKIISRTKNKISNARVTIAALEKLKTGESALPEKAKTLSGEKKI